MSPQPPTGQLSLFTADRSPLVVCCGLGVDSVAMLVGLAQRKIRPDLVIFADVGSERRSTYDYIPVLNDWLARVGFPTLTTVRYRPKNFKHWPPYSSLEENMLTNVTLPAIAYGGHSCSAKWKIQPINQFCRSWAPATDCWSRSGKVRKAIGFEDSAHERRRAARGCKTFATQADERDKFDLWFPLQEWGWTRDRCVCEIMLAGLPVPAKSSCYFCTAMKPWEVDELAAHEPDKLRRIVVIEARTAQRHLDFARTRAAKQGIPWNGRPLTEGLWRRRVKGMRGATPKPGSITEYIRTKRFLPTEEIDRIIAATPQHPLSLADFRALGFTDWQSWLHSICYGPRIA